MENLTAIAIVPTGLLLLLLMWMLLLLAAVVVVVDVVVLWMPLPDGVVAWSPCCSTLDELVWWAASRKNLGLEMVKINAI